MSEPNQLADAIAKKVIAILQMAGPISREYLTPEEVSDLTGIPTRSLEALRSSRKGPPYYKLGDYKCSRIRYKISDIRNWIESGGSDT